MKITEKESLLIINIAESYYHDGSEESLGEPVWSNCLNEGPNQINESSLGGIIASLATKGLVETQNDGTDSIVWLTSIGINVYFEIREQAIEPPIM